MKKTKENVYVVIDTPKKAKKVKKVLDIFGEKYGSATFVSAISETNKILFLNEYDTFWVGSDYGRLNRKEVSIKELRNLLAIEHLKEGDVVVCRNKKADTHIFEIKEKEENLVIYNKRYSFVDSKTAESVGSWTLDYFIRYATEEEKALLEDNPRLEVGKWYKAYLSNKGGYLLAVFNGYNKTSYGIHPDNDGEWFHCHNWFSDFNTSRLDYTEATKEEVEQALIKEAKKRGYADGVKVHSLGHDKQMVICNQELKTEYESYYNKLWFGVGLGETHHYVVVFQDGKWAEIVEPSFVESSPTAVSIETKDIAVIEQLHDLLLDVHGYSLDYKLLRDARELAQKLTKLI